VPALRLALLELRFGLLRTLARQHHARLSLIKRVTTTVHPNGPTRRPSGIRVRACSFLQPGWSETMAKEELKWQNIDADDLPTYRGKEIFRCVRWKFML
jgi:hypothetical protein